MIETITPTVCGGRKRYRFALAAFAVAAIVAAALVGALLGVAGALIGGPAAVVGAAVIAAAAAAREAGVIRLPLPQARLQVPERWHFELPLPLWASGYGAGLGIGFATYQPVATFWVACAAALALGRPLAAALCFSLYGAGRALMVTLPARLEAERIVVVEHLARRRPTLKRVNAVALAACALLLAATPAANAQQIPLGPGSQLDPAVRAGVLAYTQRDGKESAVILRPRGAPVIRYDGARVPSVDGVRLAYEDDLGIRIVDWTKTTQLARLRGRFSTPALEWPWLVYRAEDRTGRKLLRLYNVETRELRVLARARRATDIGRPSIRAGRVAWHLADARGSRVVVYTIAGSTRRVLARSRIALHAHPSLSTTHLVWVEQRSSLSSLRLRRLGRRGIATLARSGSRDRLYWTTALFGRTAYVTRWTVSADVTRLVAVRF